MKYTLSTTKFYTSGTRTSNLLDAIAITLQPYNSANTLANSVGYAMYQNTLYYKSGSLWKKSSDNSNFNPCIVDTDYDDIDYPNLRCVDNYTYDSGWKYSTNPDYGMITGRTGATTYWCWTYWNDTRLNTYSGACSTSKLVSLNSGGYSYKTNSSFQIKRTQPRTSYKSFSDF